MHKTGDLVEQSIGSRIEGTALEAPVLSGKPQTHKWYRIPLKEGLSGDGSEYHIYLKKGEGEHLCIFFSGGGVAWNEYTAARPVTGGRVAAGEPNFYWNNLRPFTQIMNINIGITEENKRNPFHDWNFVVITYATGDFHVGNNDFPYKAEDGSKQVLHFHGHKNFEESMKVARTYFPCADKILIAGDSAGAFAVPALAGEIIRDWYPGCMDYTLFSDSGQFLYKKWRHTAKTIWKAPEPLWKAIHTENITLDWYRKLVRELADGPKRRIRFLYASSVYDYLLSAYYNDVTRKTYTTDKDVQEAFHLQLIEMVEQLKALNVGFVFFLNVWKNPLTKGGTVHTAVRELYFHSRTRGGRTMAKWLSDAVNDHLYDVGLGLLMPHTKQKEQKTKRR
ncbi:MAG: pectinacetylesterase family protein [Lachnospiraceae bacterium]|nr:pectinacetylesterase family protein [Lachnospiraceae bacterium]